MTNKEIGQLIATVRRDKGMTQQQVADMLGVSQAMIAGYESGKKGINSTFLNKYFTVLGLDWSIITIEK